MCKAYKEIRFSCKHEDLAEGDEGFVPCNNHMLVSEMLECCSGVYEPGTARVGYMCLTCWKEELEYQWRKFGAEWEPRMAKADWKSLSEKAANVEDLPRAKHIARWCCSAPMWKAHRVHLPFSCFLGPYLNPDKLRKRKTLEEKGQELRPL